VQTLDEFIFVMRKSSGLTFDEALPDPKNHFGAADVCLQAEEHGLAAFVLPCFVIHNSKKIRYLPMGFWRNYLYLRRKWRKRLPFPTPCGDVTRGCLPMFQRVLRDAVMLRYWSKERAMTNVPDPAAFYESIRPKMAKLGDGNDGSDPIPGC